MHLQRHTFGKIAREICLKQKFDNGGHKTYVELIGREDSDEDFEALYIVGDEEEVFAEIYKDG